MSENHSIIENTKGSIREVSNLQTRIRVIEGLQEVLKYERFQAIKKLPDVDPDLLHVVDGSSIDQEPQLSD